MKNSLTNIVLFCLLAIGSQSLSANPSNKNYCFDADIPEAQANLADMCLTAPVLFCPATYLGCPSDNTDPSNTGTPTALPGDASCPDPIVTYTDVVIQSSNCLTIIHRTWEATYPAGSASIKLHSTCQQTIYLEDNLAPTINNCPTGVVIDLSTNCDSTAVWTVPTADDSCDLLSFTTTNFSGTTFSSGTTTVTYTATDVCGLISICSFDVTVTGSCCTTPTISCPSNVVTCPVTGSIDPSVTGSATATASDPSCGVPIITYSDATISSGPCSGASQIQRTWVATDANTSTAIASCTQLIEVVDNTLPTISNVPNNISVTANGSNCSANVTWTTPIANDNCSVTSFTSNYNSGASFNEGIYTITYTAVDNCGNTAIASFTVTVSCVCNSIPNLSCPANYIICPNNNGTLPAITGTASASAGDPSCSTPTVTYVDNTISTGPCTNEVDIQRTWIATDPNNANLSTSCTQLIQLNDNANPTISNMPANISVSGSGAGCQVPVTWNLPASADDCGISSFTSNFNSGHAFNNGTTTVTYTAIDNCGNTTVASFIVTVTCQLCNTPPTINCPADYSGCPTTGSSADPAITGMATAVIIGANCSGTPTVTYSDAVTSSAGCGNQTITRTWIATNPTDPTLTTTCTQDIVIVDSGPPTMTSLPTDITVHGNGQNCTVPVKWTDPIVSDDCGIASFTSTFPSGSNFTEGVSTVTYTAIDNCGNIISSSFNITVECGGCMTGPIVTCPSNYATCPGNMPPPPNVSGWATASAASNECGTPFLFYSDFISSFGNCAGAYNINRTFTALDPQTGISSNCVQLIQVDDTTPPTVTNLPQDIIVHGDGNGCQVPVKWTEPTASDNCGVSSMSSNFPNGTVFTEGTNTVTYTIIDNCGNITSASFNIIVQCTACNVAPSITCPATFTTCPGGAFPDPSISGTAIATAGTTNCGTPVVIHSDALTGFGNCAGAVTYTRTWTAFDPTDPTLLVNCFQTLQLDDTTLPVISNMPSNIVINGTSVNCQLPASWTLPIATDNCGIASLTSNYNSGAAFNEGTTTVTYTATDNCGNSISSSFTVTVTCAAACTTPPTITCPANYTSCPGNNIQPNVLGFAIASNSDVNCSSTPFVSYNDIMISQGPCAGAQVNQRTWTATDATSGLTSTCVQNISLIDNQPPQIGNMPANITVSGNGAGCQVPVTWNIPTATDNCDPPMLHSNHSSGSTFNIGTTTVTYVAVDDCGNNTTATFTVTVNCAECTTPPSINCPANYTACVSTGINPSITGQATANITGANCSGTPTVSFSDTVISTGPCAGEQVINRTWIATDTNTGLSSSCIQVISLVDNLPPVFGNVPQDITITSTAADCQASVTWQTLTITDDCGVDGYTSTYNSGDYFPAGTTEVLCTAVDYCNNTTTVTFSVTVLCGACITAPTLNCPTNYTACINSSTEPTATGFGTATNTGANCSATPYVTHNDVIISTGPCTGAEVIQRTWTATDPGNGLSSSCIQTIALEDTQAPIITNMPANIAVTGSGQGCSVLVTWAEPTVTDNCDILTSGCSFVNGGYFTEGTTTAVYTATDNCGNVTTASFTITVTCEGCITPPSIVCPTNYTACLSTAINPATTGYAIGSNTDTYCNPSPVISHLDEVISTGPCVGALSIIRTWTVTDTDTGFSSSCTQSINLVDNLPPTISNVPQDITITASGPNCQESVTWQTLIIEDDCGVQNTGSNYNSGDYFPEGTTEVSCYATDFCNNTTTVTFSVTVVCVACTTAPIITCPDNYTACPDGIVPDPALSGYATAYGSSSACGAPVINHFDQTLSTGPCPGEIHISRTWTASDPNDPSLSVSCIQSIDLVDTTPPVVTNCPVSLFLTGFPITGSGTGSGMGGPSCNAIATWIAPTITDDCSNVSVNVSDQNGNVVSSGDTFDEGVTVLTYVASDLCGNSASCTFNILVECGLGCTVAPVVECPTNVTVCIGGDTSVAALGTAIVTGSPNCPAPNLSHNDILIGSSNCAGGGFYHRVWTAEYPGGLNLSSTCIQEITIENFGLALNDCPENIIVNSTTMPINWTPPTMVDPCGVAVLTGTHTPGSTFPEGITTVTYTAADNCGNSVECSFTITVESLQSGGFASCPANMVLACDGNGGAYANWNMPVYNTSCSDCSVGLNIPGFLYMGTYGGSQYYCSIAPATWPQAKLDCQNNGGFLADVNSAGENQYLANILTMQSAWIGLSDVNSEGTFEWCNGDPITYSNWYPGQPNNYNNNQDYVEMLSNGQWNDQYNSYSLEYIMEIPCNYITQSNGPANGAYLNGGTYVVTYNAADACGSSDVCSFTVTVEETLTMTCPDDIVITAPYGATSIPVSWNPPTAHSCCSNCSGAISGFMYMGSYAGHHYYCSLTPDTWANSKQACIANGGDLASINSVGENNFLANILTLQSAWIGLNDVNSEGNFSWCNGDLYNYSNWYPNQPNNYNGLQHCVEMLSDGTWNDQYGSYLLEYIMEIPDCIDINHTGGPTAGSAFVPGTTTTITYSALDACGNSATCSFDVTVEAGAMVDPCVVGGSNSSNHYIAECGFGNIQNSTSDDGGYADYTNICNTIEPGQVIPIHLTPGYGGSTPSIVYWTCWIDYNQDGDFLDNYEFVAYGNGASTISGTITIPQNIYNGTCTMRITMKTDGYASDPCTSYQFGETEDYCIQVINANTIADGGEGAISNRSAIIDESSELIADEYNETEKVNVEINVYPNPVSQIMNVQINEINDIASLGLYDGQGKLVKPMKNTEKEFSTDVTNLESGMYILSATLTNGTRVSERVIIMH